MNTHDDHYAVNPIEPIDVIEQKINNPGSVPQKPLYCITQAIKYLMRSGLKKDQTWEKDIEKAQNYLTRSLTGEWIRK